MSLLYPRNTDLDDEPYINDMDDFYEDDYEDFDYPGEDDDIDEDLWDED